MRRFVLILSLSALMVSCNEDDPIDNNPAGTGLPEVITFPANKISQFKASGGGVVLDEGSSEITSRGLVWRKTPGVTLENTGAMTVDGDQTGAFLTTINRNSDTDLLLDSNTTYYMRAYAVNDLGVGYGEELSFTTMENFFMEGEPVVDGDGNTYRTVVYEKEGMTWMAENLRTTSFQNGDAIPFLSDMEAWDNDSIGAYCYWENDPYFIEDYGNFYNYFVVKDPRELCPAGFHVPSSAEWAELRDHITDFSSSQTSTSSQLKDAGDVFWSPSNINSGNDFSGFSARGAGIRPASVFGDFQLLQTATYFWTTSEFDAGFGGLGVFAFSIGTSDDPVIIGSGNIENIGHSIRCLKDD